MRKTIVGADLGARMDHLRKAGLQGLPHSEAVAVECPGYTRVFIGGTAALDEHETVVYPGDLTAQTRVIFDRIEEILGEFRGSRDDLVRVNYYVESVSEEDYLEFSRFRADWLSEVDLPVSAMVPVDDIGLDGMVVEIEADAIIPDEGWDGIA